MIVVVRFKRRIFASMRYTIHSTLCRRLNDNVIYASLAPKYQHQAPSNATSVSPSTTHKWLDACVLWKCVYLVSCRIYCKYKPFHLSRSTQRFGNDVFYRERNRFEIMCITLRYRRNETRPIISRWRCVLFHVFGEFISYIIYRVVHLTWVQWTLCVRDVVVVCICLSGTSGLFSDAVVGADAAVASLKDKMFYAIFDPIRIDFVCELTLLKVCIYCRLLEQNPKWEEKKLSRVLRSLAFVRLYSRCLWTCLDSRTQVLVGITWTLNMSIIIINNQYSYGVSCSALRVFHTFIMALRQSIFNCTHTMAMQTRQTVDDDNDFDDGIGSVNLLMKYFE